MFNKQLEKEMRTYMFDNDGRYIKLAEDIKKTVEKIDFILATKPEYLSIEEKTRLADLEVKMAKLWSILIEQTPTGKDKLSKVGKSFQEKFIRN